MHSTPTVTRTSLLASVFCTLVFSPIAQSQGIEEVVVTATRRAENIQNIPVAVSAFSSEDLANLSVTETMDVAKAVPNFVAHNNTGLGTANLYSLRGLNNTESIATFDPPVGTYIDDFFIQRQNANNYALFDVDRIEVLRGPQGTLFGRNTTGGAVRVILKDPAEEFGGFAEFGGGRFDTVTARGSVDLPATANFRMKVSGYLVNDDGFVSNVTTGENGLNYEDNIGLRGALLWDISEDVSWSASVTWIKNEHANMYNSVAEGGGRVTSTGLVMNGAPFAGLVTGDKQNFGLGNETRSLHFTSDIEWETALGTLNVLTSYLTLKQDFLLDFLNAALPSGGFSIANDGEHDQFSQEVKLTGSFGERLDYIAGVFYFNEDNETDYAQVFSFGVPLPPPLQALSIPFGTPWVMYDRVMDNGVDSWAVYAQADFHVTEQLTLTAGVRYTDEDKDFGITDNGNPNLHPLSAAYDNSGLEAAGIPQAQSESIVTPRFVLEYQASDNFMVYGSATRGFKSGGWNAREPQAQRLAPFSAEKIWSYEGGIRSDWLANRLRVNLTGFYSDVTDFQLPAAYTDPVSGAIVFLTQNFADLEIYGFEAELLANPVDNLTLFANIGIMESEYKNLDASIVAQRENCLTNGMQCGQGIINASGGIAPPVRAPEHQLAIGGWYEIPLTANINLVPRITVIDYGNHNIGTSGLAPDLLDGYTIVNGGVSIEHTTQDWTLTASCQNCTDRDQYVSDLAGLLYLQDPATWSVTLNKRF